MFKGVNDIREHDTTWIINDLKDALLKKHKETFWIKAKHNSNRADEYFHYIEAQYTQNPYIDKLQTLIETGIITLEYAMHLKPSGVVRHHGFSFKIKANQQESLFSKPEIFDLTQL